MPRILKAAVLLAAGAILLAAAGLAVLRVMFPPEKLKALALEKAREASGRDVRLGGVRLGLRGLSLSGVEVSEAPGFGSGTFLKAGSARLTVRLRPLLRRRLEVGELVLADWECRIIKNKDGSFNFSTLGPGAGPAAAPKRAPKSKSPGPPIPSFLISSLQSKNGTVLYKDPSSATDVSVTGIALTARGLKAKGPIPLTFSFATAGRAGKTDLRGRTEFKGQAELGGLDLGKASVKVEKLKASAGLLAVEASGDLKRLDAPEAVLKFKLKASPLPPLEGELEGSYARDEARLRRLSARLGDIQLKASGAARGLSAGGDLDLELQVPRFPLQALTPLAPQARELKLSGQAEARIHVSGKAASPAISGQAELLDASLTVSGQDLRGLGGTLKFSPDAAAAALKGRWGKGEFKVDLDAKDIRRAPDVRVTGSLSELDLNAWAAASEAAAKAPAGRAGAQPGGEEGTSSAKPLPLKTAGKLSVGRITHPNFTAARAQLQWSLTRVLESDKVTGTAGMKVEDGKFDNLKALGEKKSMLRAALMPLIILQKAGSLAKIPFLPAFDRVRYKEITGDYAFKDGLMTIKDSHMDSDTAYVTAAGTADLGKDELNLRLSARLGPNLGIRLGGPLSFTVRGSLSNPSVKPDVSSLIKQPEVEKAIDQGKKLLKGLFNK